MARAKRKTKAADKTSSPPSSLPRAYAKHLKPLSRQDIEDLTARIRNEDFSLADEVRILQKKVYETSSSKTYSTSIRPRSLSVC
jgi:hypothetical protein